MAQPNKRIMVPMRTSLKDLNLGKLLQGMKPTLIGKSHIYSLFYKVYFGLIVAISGKIQEEGKT